MLYTLIHYTQHHQILHQKQNAKKKEKFYGVLKIKEEEEKISTEYTMKSCKLLLHSNLVTSWKNIRVVNYERILNVHTKEQTQRTNIYTKVQHLINEESECAVVFSCIPAHAHLFVWPTRIFRLWIWLRATTNVLHRWKKNAHQTCN